MPNPTTLEMPLLIGLISALFMIGALIVFAVSRIIKLRRLEKQVYKDPLTDLYRSTYLEKNFSDFLVKADLNLSFYYVNIDNFKNYNDMFGFNLTDILLKQFSARLKEIAPTEEYVFRVHSDRFIVLSPTKKDAEGGFTDQLLNKLKKPYTVEEHAFRLTVSIGRYDINESAPTYHDVLLKSELAHEEAKRIGKDQLVVYSQKLRKEHQNMFDMYRFIKDALNNDSFYMEFQPILRTQEQTIAGVESLIRFDLKHKLLFPADIIRYAEKFNMIELIDRYVIEQSFNAFKSFKEHDVPLDFIAVNISSSEVLNEDFFDFIESTAKTYEINPSDVVIEFTETVDPERLENESRFIRRLRSIGFKVAIDDFGSGYSSMIRLSKTTLDRIKIDKSFVTDIVNSNSNQALIKAMVDLGRAFNIDVVVEGVETKEEYDFMRQQAIQYIQGYYFYKGMEANEIIRLFAKH